MAMVTLCTIPGCAQRDTRTHTLNTAGPAHRVTDQCTQPDAA